MSMSSWMIRNRPRVRRPPEDYYRLDLKKKMSENTNDILMELSSKGITETRRLSLLNGLVKVFDQTKGIGCGFTTEEFLICICSSLIHPFTQVRAAALRALRYLLRIPKDLQLFNALQLTHFVCRSLDVLLDNEEERIQALKLIRKMMTIAPELISSVLVRSLVSLGESGVEDGDRMLRACLATLCELGVLNPTQFIICGGVNAITRNVQECHSPRIAESLCGVLLHLLEWPQTRSIAGVRLDCLAAPYCDFTYRLGIMDKNKDARDLRFTCSRLALISVLRSWAGTIEFCNPNKPSGLKAIVDVLYLNQTEVRKAILDLLYELLWLPQPVWTDEYSVALAVIDPADYQDAWRLSEGFVAMEGRNVLPSLANRVPNISEIHTSMLLYCFLELGLLNALIEVVVSADTFLSVRAAVLIGKLLQLMHTHLPADICKTSSALPSLVSHATQGNHQALAAISALQNLHQMFKNRPAACSLFLDLIIQSGNIINSKLFKRDIKTYPPNTVDMLLAANSGINSGGGGVAGTIERRRHDSFESSTSTSGDERSGLSTLRRGSFKRSKIKQFFDNLKTSERMMTDSNVLHTEDGKTWDWDIITTILRSELISKMDDYNCRFIRRLVYFYKPSSNRFSHQDLGHGRHIPSFVTTGIDLIDWLIKSPELECVRLLTDLFHDINNQLMAISSSRSAHDCLFSPQHMSSTMCQMYFLYIGRMCRHQSGLNILTNTNVFKQLNHLVTTTMHLCYVKLIVSGLDYSLNPAPRRILEAALTASDCRDGRIYATQFMRVLLRARIHDFEVWGLPMLIKQTRDSDRTVTLTALEILDEACHEKTYLEELVSIWPKFESLGDQGKLIISRFYSIPRGINSTNAKIEMEIRRWVDIFNKRYVLLIEADTHAVLTLHTKNEDGTYCRRSCSLRPTVIPPNILPHLYGQLVQTSQGMDNLLKFGDLPQQIDTLLQLKCTNENDTLTLKAAMWAVAHVSTSAQGLNYLTQPTVRIFEKILHYVKYCEIYSIRATALHVLGLIGSTKDGANLLQKYDWICVRHDRDTAWPVCEPEEWVFKNFTPIRHQIDEVPPYNYTGIDENINEYYNLTDISSSRVLDESYDANSDIESQISNATRSKTLPESSAKSSYSKHARSLSESKTTDELSLLTTTTNALTSRTRFNSSTDSNTSGVSSCESFYGRYLMGDLHQTLSPIPSSSNLLEVKKPNERFRRMSLTGASFRENTLSPQDLLGYRKLRSIRRHQRPMLSESAADELADIIDGNDVTTRTGKRIVGSEQRKLKVRSLDRQSNLMIGIDEIQTRSLSFSSNRVLKTNDPKGPCYTGICLPKNIFDLFHTPITNSTYVSRCVQEMDAMELSLNKQQHFLSDSINEGDESTVSSLSDISTNSKRLKWVGKHNRSNCIQCCRQKGNGIGVAGPNSSIASNSSTKASTSSYRDSDTNSIHRRKSNPNSSIQLSDISFDSPESVFSEESTIDRITVNILRHVQRMANPVWTKQSKTALLEMKQKHPASFQDICLYSEVCKALSKNTYRLNSRRFLQELFLDLDFDYLYNESMEIIVRKDKEREATTSGLTSEQLARLHNHQQHQQQQLQQQQQHHPIDKDNISAIESASFYSNSLKSHIRSPPLPSVYETSAENLITDSLGKTTTILSGANADPMNTMLMMRSSVGNLRHSMTNDNRQPSAQTASRPRFNTLELDLSCTKNKFPITNRLCKETSPTAPTTTTPLSNAISESKLTINLTATHAASMPNHSLSTSLTSSTSSTHTTPTALTSPTAFFAAAPTLLPGHLYCEKRLEVIPKTEAALTNSNTTTNTTTTNNTTTTTTTTKATITNIITPTNVTALTTTTTTKTITKK